MPVRPATPSRLAWADVLVEEEMKGEALEPAPKENLEPAAAEWPHNPAPYHDPRTPDAPTALNKHETPTLGADQFATLSDLKVALLQVPTLVQKTVPPAVAAGFEPVVLRLVELESKARLLEDTCLSFAERLSVMESKYKHIESALDRDLRDFYHRHGLFGDAFAARALSGVARGDIESEHFGKDDEVSFSEGDEVVLHGLTKAEMNGLVGRVGPLTDATSERLPVFLATGKAVAIKPANLQRTDADNFRF